MVPSGSNESVPLKAQILPATQVTTGADTGAGWAGGKPDRRIPFGVRRLVEWGAGCYGAGTVNVTFALLDRPPPSRTVSDQVRVLPALNVKVKTGWEEMMDGPPGYHS